MGRLRQRRATDAHTPAFKEQSTTLHIRLPLPIQPKNSDTRVGASCINFSSDNIEFCRTIHTKCLTLAQLANSLENSYTNSQKSCGGVWAAESISTAPIASLSTRSCCQLLADVGSWSLSFPILLFLDRRTKNAAFFMGQYLVKGAGQRTRGRQLPANS